MREHQPRMQRSLRRQKLINFHLTLEVKQISPWKRTKLSFFMRWKRTTVKLSVRKWERLSHFITKTLFFRVLLWLSSKLDGLVFFIPPRYVHILRLWAFFHFIDESVCFCVLCLSFPFPLVILLWLSFTQIEEEFRRITTIRLLSTFMDKLDHCTPSC